MCQGHEHQGETEELFQIFLKETKETWRLNTVDDSELDPSDIKDMIRATGKTLTGDEGLDGHKASTVIS